MEVMMKIKIMALIVLAVIVLTFLVSCVTNTPGNDDTLTCNNETETEVPPESSEAETIGEAKDELTVPKSLKILAVGNSFSTDSMQYLFGILENAGVESITLGNLYYGGCSLAQHVTFAKNNSASYTYYKNTSGEWVSTKSYTIENALADEEWDFISLQQTSKTCGIKSSYNIYLNDLVTYVKGKCPNAKLIWNMTWAYQQDSTHASFPNYDKDQKKMYDMIIDVMNDCIISDTRFDLYIPCMTSIQNARTSFLGDTLTRDGYHLDYYIGRYIAGLTWFASITGLPVDDITYNPDDAKISVDMLAVAKESVANAMKTPLAVTESKIKEGKRPEGSVIDPSVVLNPEDFFDADKTVALQNGVDLTKYTLLEWEYNENTYWNCTSKAGTTSPNSSAGTYKQNVCSKRKYSLAELPVGTVFITDSGWQFRPEIYTDENSKYTGTRPSMVTSRFFVLTKDFMGNASYIAWNISSNPKSDISAIYHHAAVHVRVYVPQK